MSQLIIATIVWLTAGWTSPVVVSAVGQSRLRAVTSCSPDNRQHLHFELVTGQVYTAPEDMLDSRPGTLMLTDCIDLCRSVWPS